MSSRKHGLLVFVFAPAKFLVENFQNLGQFIHVGAIENPMSALGNPLQIRLDFRDKGFQLFNGHEGIGFPEDSVKRDADFGAIHKDSLLLGFFGVGDGLVQSGADVLQLRGTVASRSNVA